MSRRKFSTDDDGSFSQIVNQTSPGPFDRLNSRELSSVQKTSEDGGSTEQTIRNLSEDKSKKSDQVVKTAQLDPYARPFCPIDFPVNQSYQQSSMISPKKELSGMGFQTSHPQEEENDQQTTKGGNEQMIGNKNNKSSRPLDPLAAAFPISPINDSDLGTSSREERGRALQSPPGFLLGKSRSESVHERYYPSSEPQYYTSNYFWNPNRHPGDHLNTLDARHTAERTEICDSDGRLRGAIVGDQAPEIWEYNFNEPPGFDPRAYSESGGWHYLNDSGNRNGPESSVGMTQLNIDAQPFIPHGEPWGAHLHGDENIKYYERQEQDTTGAQFGDMMYPPDGLGQPRFLDLDLQNQTHQFPEFPMGLPDPSIRPTRHLSGLDHPTGLRSLHESPLASSLSADGLKQWLVSLVHDVSSPATATQTAEYLRKRAESHGASKRMNIELGSPKLIHETSSVDRYQTKLANKRLQHRFAHRPTTSVGPTIFGHPLSYLIIPPPRLRYIHPYLNDFAIRKLRFSSRPAKLIPASSPSSTRSKVASSDPRELGRFVLSPHGLPGLENAVPADWVLSILFIIYYSLPPIRREVALHTCGVSSCWICELGFLFRLMDLAKTEGRGIPCRADNVLAALLRVSQARCLGLIDSEYWDVSDQMDMIPQSNGSGYNEYYSNTDGFSYQVSSIFPPVPSLLKSPESSATSSSDGQLIQSRQPQEHLSTFWTPDRRVSPQTGPICAHGLFTSQAGSTRTTPLSQRLYGDSAERRDEANKIQIRSIIKMVEQEKNKILSSHEKRVHMHRRFHRIFYFMIHCICKLAPPNVTDTVDRLDALQSDPSAFPDLVAAAKFTGKQKPEPKPPQLDVTENLYLSIETTTRCQHHGDCSASKSMTRVPVLDLNYEPWLKFTKLRDEAILQKTQRSTLEETSPESLPPNRNQDNAWDSLASSRRSRLNSADTSSGGNSLKYINLELSRGPSFVECLAASLRRQELNPMFCGRCDTVTTHVVQTEVIKLPDILAVKCGIADDTVPDDSPFSLSFSSKLLEFWRRTQHRMSFGQQQNKTDHINTSPQVRNSAPSTLSSGCGLLDGHSFQFEKTSGTESVGASVRTDAKVCGLMGSIALNQSPPATVESLAKCIGSVGKNSVVPERFWLSTRDSERISRIKTGFEVEKGQNRRRSRSQSLKRKLQDDENDVSLNILDNSFSYQEISSSSAGIHGGVCSPNPWIVSSSEEYKNGIEYELMAVVCSVGYTWSEAKASFFKTVVDVDIASCFTSPKYKEASVIEASRNEESWISQPPTEGHMVAYLKLPSPVKSGPGESSEGNGKVAKTECSEGAPRKNEEEKYEWHWFGFNSSVVFEADLSEAVDFTPLWKHPCLFIYAKIDSVWNSEAFLIPPPPPLPSDSLSCGTSISLCPPELSQFNLFTPLSADEIQEVRNGKFLAALDAEHVVSQMFRKHGVTAAYPILSLGRISILRGSGPLEGVPFMDHYVHLKYEPVDYLTAYSGLHPGDLDIHSPHFLTTSKFVYQVLRYLIHYQCSFVGHDLFNDFRVINIFVPSNQIVDTVELFRLSQSSRLLSLKFLAYHVLHIRVQQQIHDSIEDARCALELYKEYIKVLINKNEDEFRVFVGRLYEIGYKDNFKVDDDGDVVADQFMRPT